MNDPLNRLEREMAAMHPVSMSEELIGRIEIAVAENEIASPWPDRFLMSAMASGAIAACTILVILLGGGARSAEPRINAMQAVVPAPRASGIVISPFALARADAAWAEILK